MPTSLKWEALPVPGCLVVAAAAAGGRPLVPDSHGHRLQPLIRHTQVEGRQVGTQLMCHTLHNLRVDSRHLLASTTKVLEYKLRSVPLDASPDPSFLFWVNQETRHSFSLLSAPLASIRRLFSIFVTTETFLNHILRRAQSDVFPIEPVHYKSVVDPDLNWIHAIKNGGKSLTE